MMCFTPHFAWSSFSNECEIVVSCVLCSGQEEGTGTVKACLVADVALQCV